MRKFLVNVNGTSYEVMVEEMTGAPCAQMAAPQIAAAAPQIAAPQAAAPQAAAPQAPAPVAAGAGQTIASPMPGNILAVNVKPGDTVKTGQVVMILEAMKMENEIMSPFEGTVQAINVAVGTTVSAGDVLAVIG